MLKSVLRFSVSVTKSVFLFSSLEENYAYERLCLRRGTQQDFPRTALSFSKPQGDRGDPIKDEVNQDPTNHQRTLRTDEQTL